MRRVTERVPIEECCRRAFAVLSGTSKPASSIAQAIWPEASWRAAQGAGAAASRVLKAMEKDGRAAWIVRGEGRSRVWGWVRR